MHSPLYTWDFQMLQKSSGQTPSYKHATEWNDQQDNKRFMLFVLQYLNHCFGLFNGVGSLIATANKTSWETCENTYEDCTLPAKEQVAMVCLAYYGSPRPGLLQITNRPKPNLSFNTICNLCQTNLTCNDAPTPWLVSAMLCCKPTSPKKFAVFKTSSRPNLKVMISRWC